MRRRIAGAATFVPDQLKAAAAAACGGNEAWRLAGTMAPDHREIPTQQRSARPSDR